MSIIHNSHRTGVQNLCPWFLLVSVCLLHLFCNEQWTSWRKTPSSSGSKKGFYSTNRRAPFQYPIEGDTQGEKDKHLWSVSKTINITHILLKRKYRTGTWKSKWNLSPLTPQKVRLKNKPTQFPSTTTTHRLQYLVGLLCICLLISNKRWSNAAP